MTDAEKYKLHNLCYQAKLGKPISEEDSKWLRKMYKAHPEEYKVVHRKAAQEAIDTVNPFANRT